MIVVAIAFFILVLSIAFGVFPPQNIFNQNFPIPGNAFHLSLAIIANQNPFDNTLRENLEPVWPLFGQNFPKIRFGPKVQGGGLVVGYFLQGQERGLRRYGCGDEGIEEIRCFHAILRDKRIYNFLEVFS